MLLTVIKAALVNNQSDLVRIGTTLHRAGVGAAAPCSRRSRYRAIAANGRSVRSMLARSR